MDTSQRPPRANVGLFQPSETVPPHIVTAFITAEGDAGEEGRIVSMMADYARHVGADAVVLLGADRPNESLAIAHPIWQPPGRRVFRANVVMFAGDEAVDGAALKESPSTH